MTCRRSEGGKAPGATGAGSVLEAGQAVRDIAFTPLANGVAVTIQGVGNLLIGRLLGLRGRQDNPTPEGQRFRRMVNLELIRPHFPMFALTWTLMHKIDEKSPIHGLSAEALVRDGVRFMLSIEARDPALSAQVHDLKSYSADTLAFGMRYADAVYWDESGRTLADIRRCSAMEPDLPAPPAING